MDRIPRDAAGRVDIKCMTRERLARYCETELGDRRGRSVAVYKRLWQRAAHSFAEIEEIRRTMRQGLAERATISWLNLEQVLASQDGTRKYLWRLPEGDRIESVLIPEGNRLTLCVSSQVGCAMGCTFCLTGDLGLKRQLTVAEIVNQPLQVAQDLPAGQRITNLVFMGMGEPLHNLENLCDALTILLDDHALNFSHRKITVSTVGLVPQLAELARRLPVNLAISLNATTEEQRRRIMPLSRRYSLEQLLQACREIELPAGKRITFEYVMFAGFNDSLEDARRLYDLLQGIEAKVNLIPYNENPARNLRQPAPRVVRAFQDHLVQRGLCTSVRSTRGRDISAACGQLGRTTEQLMGRLPMVP